MCKMLSLHCEVGSEEQRYFWWLWVLWSFNVCQSVSREYGDSECYLNVGWNSKVPVGYILVNCKAPPPPPPEPVGKCIKISLCRLALSVVERVTGGQERTPESHSKTLLLRCCTTNTNTCTNTNTNTDINTNTNTNRAEIQIQERPQDYQKHLLFDCSWLYRRCTALNTILHCRVLSPVFQDVHFRWNLSGWVVP